METHYLDPVDNKESLELWAKFTDPALMDMEVCMCGYMCMLVCMNISLYFNKHVCICIFV